MRPKTNQEIAAMREGGAMLAGLLRLASGGVVAGARTLDIANLIRPEFKRLGVVPSFLGYENFPEVACISVNEQVVHGIPSNKMVLKDGDIVSIDLGLTYRGMIVDSAVSVIVGGLESAPARSRELVAATKQSMEAGIDAINGGGTRIGSIGAAIQAVLDAHNLGIVRDLVGHGVGHELHEDPNIPNYGMKGSGSTLQTGMTVAIEPMATLGGWQVNIQADGWTVATRDGSLAAHFEHTVLITDDGAEILTIEPN